jgi:DnaJ-class molecular chaperone
MSKAKYFLEVGVDRFTPKTEDFMFSGFECPGCNGSGGGYEEISRDKSRFTACPKCEGTGKLKVVIGFKWLPDMD